ncbi:hypothetical protein CFIO01_04671 [Colletotrichum fioriniae PJ7]|uniref:Uncharacterized protein n=1 Tax=Colletotrichum fioriniae PJ7 TaxID=1445577 RepID=A0A010Q8J1_9PEZI|nr:hypothetical protein CFIO01_04671 [Colletotrichum fioriniae PJ7]
MESKDSTADSPSIPNQSNDPTPFVFDQTGFNKSLGFVQEVRSRFEASQPEKSSAFLEILQEIDVPPRESIKEWQAARAEKQAAARTKLEVLFDGHADLLEKFDAFLPATST